MTTAVVTGAASGMGRACVESLRGLADVLVAVDLSVPDIDGTVGVACDVSDPTAVAALSARVRELGSFRALAHAAGISPTMAGWRDVVTVDLTATAMLTEALLPLATTGTAIVCFASIAPLLAPDPGDAAVHAALDEPLHADVLDRLHAALGTEIEDSGMAYMWAKVGVIRAVGRAAVRWGHRGGRVNSIAPGLIDTPMGRQEFEQQPAMKEMLERTPLGRFGGATEVAAVVAYLVSDAASFVSGIDVLVDGGMMQGMTREVETHG